MLNGQQYAPTELSFAYLADVAISALSPAAGPADGATLVRIAGGNFSGGDDRRCRFGVPDGMPPNATAHETVVRATLDASGGGRAYLLCLTPLTSPGSMPLEVTLNGQQYTNSSATIAVYPQPHVSSSARAAGRWRAAQPFAFTAPLVAACTASAALRPQQLAEVAAAAAASSGGARPLSAEAHDALVCVSPPNASSTLRLPRHSPCT